MIEKALHVALDSSYAAGDVRLVERKGVEKDGEEKSMSVTNSDRYSIPRS